jgi:membrane protein YdbS with pleckstrin-like domain
MQQPYASAFDPPPTGWVRVSARLATARRIVALALLGPVAVVGVVLVVLDVTWAGGLLVALALVGVVWTWVLFGRQARAIGYAERGDDLLVTRGIMFRSLVVVPYGRMQLVDVHAGPLDRAFGIARLQLHTAAATTDATIHGIPVDEARRLRDRLASLGEARTAGL